MATKTELEFNYEPSNYFEEAQYHQLSDGELRADEGKAVVVLDVPADPVPDALRARVSQEVESVFKLRQLLDRRPFRVLPPAAVQYGIAGVEGRAVFLSIDEVIHAHAADRVDLVTTNANGEVIHDTRAERIAEHKRFISSLLPKMSNNSMRAMVDSYCKAIDDPANELVHLYEIRDAACEHYGNEATARARLGVSRDDWRNLRRLSNDKPLNQGRHRGVHALSLRDATAEELEQARNIARHIIEAFAATI
jgi:hypothetical protein